MDGNLIELKVWEITGKEAGPTALIAAGTHGNELNGVEVCRKFVEEIEREEIHGTLLVAPVLNPLAFQMRARLNPADGRDPSQLYPGTLSGTATEQLVHNISEYLVSRAQLVIDLHSGGIGSKNIPHIYVPSKKPTRCEFSCLNLAEAFGGDLFIDTRPEIDYHFSLTRTLATYSNEQGAASFAPELGEGGIVEGDMIRFGIRGITNVLTKIGILRGTIVPQGRRLITHRSAAVQAPVGGFLRRHYQVGNEVAKGQHIATIYGIFGGKEELYSPVAGIVQWTSLFGNVTPGEQILWIGYS